MRSQLTMKLGGLAALVVMIIFGAHACSASTSGTLLSPSGFAHAGLSGICADQQAAAAANGDAPAAASTTPQTLLSPSQLTQVAGSDPGGSRALTTLIGGAPTCAPPVTSP